jgi:hypothetical protein
MESPAAFVLNSERVSWALLGSTVIAFFMSGYLYLYAENYNYQVEAPCDAEAHECYVRDCSQGECPPNDLTDYRVFLVPAAHFKNCTDNSCANVCLAPHSPCKEMLCSENGDATCHTL